jgi:hypothetical protein
MLTPIKGTPSPTDNFPFMVVGRMVGRVVGQEPGLELNMPNATVNRFLSRVVVAKLSLLP